MGWHTGEMLGFDTETTGVDFATDHILSASLVHIVPGRPAYSNTDWINPGVPIPAAATRIHGITDESIQLNGGDPASKLGAIAAVLHAVLSEHDVPLVGQNIAFDLTMLDTNCRRHGVPTVSERLSGHSQLWPVVDTLVLDKKLHRYRKGTGARRLGSLCKVYNVPEVRAHDSAADALVALQIAWRMGTLYPRLGSLPLADLHALQVQWKLEQDAEFTAYRRRENNPVSDADGQWPIRIVEAVHGVNPQQEVPV